jgi:uncharacterized protein DUF6627
MKSAWTRTICRVLAALMIWTPVQFAHAGVIGTAQAVAAAAPAERAAVLGFVGRADVARELQALGVDAAAAKERIAAMTDQEAQSLAGRIDSLPAGADVGGIAVLLIILIFTWWAWYRY